MIRSNFFLAFVILWSCTYTQDCFASNIDSNYPKKKKRINKELIDKVNFIREEHNLPEKNIFFFFDFLQKNDSTFLEIGYDFNPPLIMSNEVESLGYLVYKNDTFILLNRKLSIGFINYFVEVKKLKKNIDKLVDMYRGSMDGYTYVFYINELKELIFVRKDF